MSQVKCTEIELLLDAYHDGELTAEQTLLVEQHLLPCSHCQGQLAEIGRLVSTLQELPKLELSSDFAQRLDVLLEQKPKVVVLRPVFWAALAACAAFCLLFIGSHQSQSLKQARLPQPSSLTQEIAALPPTSSKASPSIAIESSLPAKVAPMPAAKTNDSAVVLSNDNNKLEIASLLEDDRNTITESIGLDTDEDGLYALKM